MQRRDILGRRRQQTQNRGLRSLFPKLPPTYRSRLIRVAMTHFAWTQLDALAAESHASTTPRAYGEALERLLARHTNGQARPHKLQEPLERVSNPVTVGGDQGDWQTWQMHKERTLLASIGQRT